MSIMDQVLHYKGVRVAKSATTAKNRWFYRVCYGPRASQKSFDTLAAAKEFINSLPEE